MEKQREKIMMPSEGLIVEDKDTKDKYRIFFCGDGKVHMCKLNTTSFEIEARDEIEMRSDVRCGSLSITEDIPIFVDESLLSPSMRSSLDAKMRYAQEIENEFGPTFEELASRTRSADVRKICAKYGFTTKTGWKYIRKYIQAGRNPYALVESSFHLFQSKFRDKIYA